jgi:serine phosphatase RsbU (regulator of sigma subunit)
VSGDFYYVTEINNSKILFCADCTGHGVPGALMSMVGSNLIHKIIHEHKIYEPKLILETLHYELRHSLKQDITGSNNRDGMDACIVSISDNELIYSGANRPLFYIDSNNDLQEIKATKTPLGGSHIEKVEIVQHHIDKSSLKEFYLFSDGFADQFGGPDGKKLMVSRFKKWLQDITHLNSEEKQQFIISEFIKWKNNLEQVDDVMVIGVTL